MMPALSPFVPKTYWPFCWPNAVPKTTVDSAAQAPNHFVVIHSPLAACTAKPIHLVTPWLRPWSTRLRGAAANPFDRAPDRVMVFGYCGHIRCKHRCVIMRAQQFSPHTGLDAKKRLPSQLFVPLYLPDGDRRGETAAARSDRFANTGD